MWVPHQRAALVVGIGSPFTAELARIRSVDLVDLPTGHWPQSPKAVERAAAILEAIGD